MRKILHMILIVFILIPMLVVPEEAQAKTLGDLKKELSDLEAKYQASKQEEEETKGKLDFNKTKVKEIEATVTKLEQDVKKLAQEIETLSKKIVEKEEEIKKVVNFLQRSSGEMAYLEFAFGAKDFTDFIYRVSVSEQLVKHNNKLVKDFEDMIKKNKKSQKEMSEKRVELAKEKERLNDEVKKLGERLNEISFIQIDTGQEIEMQRQAVKAFEASGCLDHEDVNTCGKILPTDTAFLRPIVSGYVTSEYGYRVNPITGNYELHEAMDMSQSNRYVPIYAAANGTVIGMVRQSNCGGNMLFILHTINGVKYTTEYAHLRTIDVSVGQVVTKNTQIATMGGDMYTETWDSCSKFQHLHFGIAKGHYLKDYTSWSSFLANTFDPRKIVNFPFTGGSVDPFSDRITRY